MSTLARPWIIPIAALLGIAVLAGACGDGGGTTTADATLTDPRGVPTATPWSEPPEPIFPEEGAITPIADGGTPLASGETYIVQSGDTPFGICLQFDCDHNELMQINGITDPTKLYVGQELKLP